MIEASSVSTSYPSTRVFFNIVGGSLTLLSVQLPWITVYGLYPVSVQFGGLYVAAFYWALAGAILSFLSRFGGVMTLIGVLSFFGEPFTVVGDVQPASGVLLAVTGAVLAFAGVRWWIPREMIVGRELLGGVLYSVGFLIILILTINSVFHGGLFLPSAQLIVEAPLLLIGVMLTGLGLKLYLSGERRETSLKVIGPA